MAQKTDNFCQKFTEILGTLFKERRALISMTQQKLSEKIDVSRVTIGKWEKGKTRPDIYEFYNAMLEIDPSFSFFWQELKKRFETNVEPQKKAAEKEKYRKYIEQTKQKRQLQHKNSL